MVDKSLYRNGVLFFLCLLLTAVGFGQDCEPLALDSIANPGVYTVATLTEADGLRDGPDYTDATVYYPVDAAPPFAGIAIVPGYVSSQSSIQDWGPFLASHGIVVMTIGTNSLFDDPYNRRDALLDALVSLTEENSRSDSPLLGKLDTDRMAVGGWSMGGGGAQLAAAADPNLKAAMALCPWLGAQTQPSEISHPVPVLIFSGEADAIAPPAVHADVHYVNTPDTTDKLIFEVDNAGHSVANGPTGGQGQVGQVALSWLNHFLLGDSCYCPLLLDMPSSASYFATNVVCQQDPVSVSRSLALDEPHFQLYPSPSDGRIQVKMEGISEKRPYEVISITGASMASGVLSGQITRIDLQHIPSGLYFLRIQTPKSSETIPFIVL